MDVPDRDAAGLLEGAVDMHVHSYPDLVPRAVDDLTMARLARDAGMAGFLLKSHYAPTAERAWLVQQIVPEVRVIGSVVLNHFVGGLNPLAVESLARAGGRLVYMPTSDAANEAGVLDSWDPDRPLPPYLQIKTALRDRGRLREPITLLDDRGEITRECHDVLDVIKEHDLVLATGHVSAQEAYKVVEAAHGAGITRILVTHPESPHINMSVEMQLSMLSFGAVFERCFAYLDDPELADAAFEAVRATGVDNNILSSDLGMVGREDPVTGLERFARLAIAHGFSEDEVRHMVVTAPAELLDEDGLGQAWPGARTRP